MTDDSADNGSRRSIVPRTGGYRGWSVAAATLTLLVVLPYLPVVTGLVGAPGETWIHLRETVLSRYFFNTVVLGAGAVGLAVVIGTGGAWILHRNVLPGGGFLELLFVAPIALPVYIGTFTWSGILGYGGPLFRATGYTMPFSGLPAAIFVLGFGLYPYVYLTVRSAMRSDSGVLFEAVAALSDIAGEPRWGYVGKLVRGVLPTLRPAIVGGASLVAMEVMNAYATPVYLGIETLSTGVFRTWFALGDLPSATRLAAYVLILILVLLAVERAGRGRRRFSAGATGRPAVALRPGPVKGIALAGSLLVPAVLGFLLPVAQLTGWTLGSDAGALTGLGTTAARTIGLAATATVVIVSIAIFINYTAYLERSRTITALRSIAGIGYAVPGTVIAIGVLVVFRSLRLIDERLFLFGTIPGLIFAYTGRYLSVALQPIRAAFDRNHRSTVDAARSLGGRPGRVLRRVVLPVFRPTVAGAALLVAIDVVKDLPMTLLLRPFDFSTLAVEVYRLAGDERMPEAAPRALLLVALGILTILVIMRRGSASSRRGIR
ncbi:MAG: ABC transporter permease [Alkalispirochaeta sp.]